MAHGARARLTTHFVTDAPTTCACAAIVVGNLHSVGYARARRMPKSSSSKKPAPKPAPKPASPAAKVAASKGPVVSAPAAKAPVAKAPVAKVPASNGAASASGSAPKPAMPAKGVTSAGSSAGTVTASGAVAPAAMAPGATVSGSLTPGSDGKPVPPRPSRPPAPVTGTAAMKSLAQRNAAALRPATDPSDMSGEAQRILTEGDATAVLALGEALAAERQVSATCKILDDVLAAKPDLLVGLVDRFVVLVAAPNKRTVQTVAVALPVMARLAPARVARHLQALTDRFPECNEVGKDGLVSTFAALCMASVAYQKRLEPVLELALASADPKTLQRWAEIILPSLKGEPHARARAVVEGRLPAMPRPLAQPIATFLGIKLRPAAS